MINPKEIFIVIIICAIAAGLWMSNFAGSPFSGEQGKNNARAAISAISPQGHELIKATVLNETPSNFTIDVKKFANMSVDQDAPTFAVYVSDSKPSKCGDFRSLELNYTKPDEYKRQFDLSGHPDVLAAIDTYGCVVMRNIPSS
jgi:hypothetical protein